MPVLLVCLFNQWTGWVSSEKGVVYRITLTPCSTITKIGIFALCALLGSGVLPQRAKGMMAIIHVCHSRFEHVAADDRQAPARQNVTKFIHGD